MAINQNILFILEKFIDAKSVLQSRDIIEVVTTKASEYLSRRLEFKL